jgi:hypothetical protein
MPHCHMSVYMSVSNLWFFFWRCHPCCFFSFRGGFREVARIKGKQGLPRSGCNDSTSTQCDHEAHAYVDIVIFACTRACALVMSSHACAILTPRCFMPRQGKPHTHSPLRLTKLSPPMHFPLLRYPLAPLHLVVVCEALTSSSLSPLTRTTPTPRFIYSP